MTQEAQFTQAHAEALAIMDEKLDNITKELHEMKGYMEKCYYDLEGRTRDIEIHGSAKVQDLHGRVSMVEKDIVGLRDQVNYERGRLFVIFTIIGAGVATIISWVFHTFSGGGG